MGWNYRMTRQTGSWGTAYEIREIYYDEAGKPNGCSDSVGPFGETEEELAHCLAQMASAIGQPVLDLDSGDWVPTEEAS
jgi:hypothetical protein